MARPKSPSIEPIAPALKPGALAHVSQNINELALIDAEAEMRTLTLARKLGYDGSLDPDLIVRGLSFQIRRTVEMCLETGRMLLILKERVGHGNFMTRLEGLQIEYRGAAKFMQAALKFSNVPTNGTFAASIGSQSKLIELLTLDQEQIEELATEGSVLGITTDEISSLSISELRARLREAKERDTAKDRIIAKEKKKRDELQDRLERPFVPGEDAHAANEAELEQVEELREASLAAELAIRRLAVVAADVLGGRPTKAMSTAASNAVEYVCQRLADITTEHSLPVQFEEMIKPAWFDPEALKVSAAKAKK